MEFQKYHKTARDTILMSEREKERERELPLNHIKNIDLQNFGQQVFISSHFC